MKFIGLFFTFFVLLGITTSLGPSLFAENPVEIGKVIWGRDLEGAFQKAKGSKKPIFLLFQEVPGCSGCQQFGKEVLSDPLIVKVVEESFIPVFVYNNRSGKEAEVLKRFQEPAWNFQVVRFLNEEGRDWIEREEGIWTREALAKRMKIVLEKAKNAIPEELSLLLGEKSAEKRSERIAFAQSCFWNGEMRLGGVEGVTQTEVGFMEGREVTVVDYDPQQVSLKQLIKKAHQMEVADRIYLTSETQKIEAKELSFSGIASWKSDYRRAPQSDQKRQLQGTIYERQSLSAEQSTKVNAFVRTEPEKVVQYLKR